MHQQPELDPNIATRRQLEEPVAPLLDARPCLEVLGGRHQKLATLESGSNLIGRHPLARAVLSHHAVSRRHAEVLLGLDGRAMIVDRGSTNGTFVNGERISRAMLREGDRVRIGWAVELRFGHYRVDCATPRQLAQPNDLEGSGPLTPLPLTAREREIARLVADGLSNPKIGARLFISARTVGTHLNNIYKRLGIHSRVQLTRLVISQATANASPPERCAAPGSAALASDATTPPAERPRRGPVSERAALRHHRQSERASHPGPRSC